MILFELLLFGYLTYYLKTNNRIILYFLENEVFRKYESEYYAMNQVYFNFSFYNVY